ncbi:concanavalin A-like lectin/glucanase domain-containing protein [Lasiosphaeris hirsuta]|uniref:Concanavalin A-like lectin/glucanase domain-containing protein n=1 Tax=Lasiosphaeris hirsuta TaxID=260670 RepID=A0AA40B9R1_9PEZI|nr:concanavalin A-like lectin/glucanase domain-containing protein [Lasiosphaeris hirsuta]
MGQASLLLSAGALFFTAITAVSIPPGFHTVAGAASVPIPPGFSRIIFEDDFSKQPAGSQPSTAKWSYSVGTSYPGGPANWGTKEIQSYSSSRENLVITSGALAITPLNNGGRWTSARIESTPAHDIACAAGGKLRIEASLKFGKAPPSEQMGIWPSFWAIGSGFRGNTDRWPAVGELDVAESINGQPTTWQMLHCGWTPGGPCNEFNGIGGPVPFTRGEFHTVAVEVDRTNGGDWRGERLLWYIDGRLTSSVDGTRVNDEGAWTAVTRNPKFLILNVAVGGDFPNNVANDGRVLTPTPETKGGPDSAMEVRYIAVFST